MGERLVEKLGLVGAIEESFSRNLSPLWCWHAPPAAHEIDGERITHRDPTSVTGRYQVCSCLVDGRLGGRDEATDDGRRMVAPVIAEALARDP